MASRAKRARHETKGEDESEANEAFDSAVAQGPIARVSEGSHVSDMEHYHRIHSQSLATSDAFWATKAREMITWFRDFDYVSTGSFMKGDLQWFGGGKLNVSYNCLDRHVINGRADQTAIIWESDEPGEGKKFTYREALEETCRIANMLKAHGVKKGDTVAIYLPMIPEIAFTMLACARIGAPHSVVFAGFSSEALRDRILDAKSKWVITSDEGRRGGRTLGLKKIVDAAVAGAACVEKVFVFTRTGGEVAWNEDLDVRASEEVIKQRPFCPPEHLDSEDMLFLLYTSGSTGRPKGVVHTQAGYLLYTQLTTKISFDIREGDVFACVADCGWITGHSYIVYGPLGLGTTTVMFESTPLYPDAGRYWDLVQRYKVNSFYTAPTAIRALMKYGVEPVKKYDLSSLRILGSVGEPINPEAWRWYHDNVGRGKCAIVDTFWQTETGGHVVTPMPGATPLKPGSACFGFFGIDTAILDPKTGKEKTENCVSGVLCIRRPWPSLARTVFGDHERYLTTYMRPYPGFYFTGDGAYRDKDGYIWVTGRVDDVLNVSGHRLGSAEIESALVAHEAVSEAAVIGFPHDTKGEAVCCYVTLIESFPETPELLKDLRMQVRKVIGPFATPDYIVATPGLPKTRSGKIMRRVLRKIISREADKLGDISTLADSAVVEGLINKVNKMFEAKK